MSKYQLDLKGLHKFVLSKEFPTLLYMNSVFEKANNGDDHRRPSLRVIDPSGLAHHRDNIVRSLEQLTSMAVGFVHCVRNDHRTRSFHVSTSS